MFFQANEQPRMHYYRNTATVFVILALIVVVAVFYISFSWATITLTVRGQSEDKTFSVRISEKTNDEQGVIAGRIVVQELEAEGTFTPDFSTVVAQKATGTITVVNTTSKSQILRPTTRLLASDGTLFRTTEFATIGAKGSKELSVVADKAGDIPQMVGTRFILPGLWPGLQDKIYGQGFVPKEQGSKKMHILMQADIDKAINEMIRKLHDQFISLANTSFTNEGFNPRSGSSVVSSHELSTFINPPLGSQTDTFNIRIKNMFKGVFFDGYDMKAYVLAAVEKELQSGYSLSDLDSRKFEYILEDVDSQNGKALITLKTSVRKTPSNEYLSMEKRSFAGRTTQQTIDYFSGIPSISAVQVKFYPFWVTRMPLLHDHINIIVQSGGP